MRAIEVAEESGVAEARRIATKIAGEIGWDETEAGRVAIVVTELATNLVKHARGGRLLVGVFDDDAGAGVECIALDRGPGIADLGAAMADGYSTAGSAGSGLGAIARLSHAMDVYTRPGQGAAILARLQKGDPARARPTPPPACGAVSLPMPGEEACGDAWRIKRLPDGLHLLVVDGLGHGPLAATAAHAAVRAFEASDGAPTPELMARLHQALRPTRGAAASVVAMPDGAQSVVFIGVGNVAGIALSDLEAKRMVSFNGTLGHSLKTVRPFVYPTAGETLVVLASDGLATSWSLDPYPGLRSRHPSLIAAVLCRDFNRGRDDVTVLVARRPAP
jgi:anti-sigma regulatory factor (Ser/Thr protein kinase)